MQRLEVRAAQVALDLPERARANLRALDHEVVVHGRPQGVVGAPFRRLGALRVTAERDLGERLLGSGARLLGAEHVGRAKQQPSRATGGPVLDDEGLANPAASLAQAQAVAGKSSSQMTWSSRPVGSSAAATVLALSFMAMGLSRVAPGKQRLLSGALWCGYQTGGHRP